jgi:hypothetical protein
VASSERILAYSGKYPVGPGKHPVSLANAGRYPQAEWPILANTRLFWHGKLLPEYPGICYISAIAKYNGEPSHDKA